MATYDVPNDGFLKKKWISYAGERWRAFKTTLTQRYIYGDLKDKNPCENYKYLDEETWKRFVYGCQDLVVQEERKKGQKAAGMNKCPHRLSHGGYELLKEKMMEDKLKKRQEASQIDSSIVLSPPSPPMRHEKWKRARTKESGEFTSEAIWIVAEKIDSLVEQSSQGTFVPVGREDILIVAIGRPEYPGLVRAAGRGVGIQQYFGSLSHCSKVVNVPREVIGALKEELNEQMERSFAEKLKLKIREELASMGIYQGNTNAQHSPTPIVVSTKESNIQLGEEIPEEDLLDILDECKLYIDDPLRLVAFGKVCNLGPTIHHKKINDDMVRVTVERVKDANAPVPVPTKEVQIVG